MYMQEVIMSDNDTDMSASEANTTEVPSTSTPVSGEGQGSRRGQRRQRGRGRGQRRGRGRGGRVRGRGRGQGQGRTEAHSVPGSGAILPNTAADITTPDSNPPPTPAFTPNRTSGPHLPPDTDISAISFFQLFFTNVIINRLVQSTIVYAEAKQSAKPSMYKRFHSKDLSIAEMMRFLCALLLLGITDVRSYRKAWNTKNAQFIVRLNELMSRNRFEAISSFLHVVTPEEEEQHAQHPLRKILALHSHMKTTCKQLYQPLQQVSIDERIVKSIKLGQSSDSI